MRPKIIVGAVAIALAIGSTIVGCQTQQSSPSPEETKTPAAPEQAKTPAAVSQPMSVPTSSESSTGATTERAAEPILITPPKEGCKISMAIVADPDPPLNVRSSPQIAEGNMAGSLDNGTYVSIAEESNGWLRITDPVEGWIVKSRTESSCANVSEPIKFAPNGNSAIVRGRIIGAGSHQYLLDASQGQTMKITKLNAEGVFPTFVAPNGEIIAGDPYTDAERTKWSGTLSLTGQYTLQLDSNFRGFEYEFLVEVK